MRNVLRAGGVLLEEHTHDISLVSLVVARHCVLHVDHDLLVHVSTAGGQARA